MCGDEVAANYANMFIISLAGFMVSGLFLGRQYFDYLFTIAACIFALKRACLVRWNDQAAADELMAEEAAVA